MKKILILGGTNFIGRNLVEKLIELDSYDLCLFNRQKSAAELFPSISKIKGDRESEDIKQIEGTDWDYVIDLSCYYPDALRKVLSTLKSIDRYIFISTCSVYDNQDKQVQLKNEESEILSCSLEEEKDHSPASYGNRKAECERILQNSGFAYTILRPALVFGKYDPTDRLYYWLYQARSQKQLVLPENGERLFSTTYVMDLVESIIRALKSNGASSIYNVVTKPQSSIKEIIEIASADTLEEKSLIHAPAEFLKQEGIKEWMDMPLWINGDHFTYRNDKLKQELGLPFTDFRKAIIDTIQYYNEIDWPEPHFGISEMKKKDLALKLGTS